MSAPDSIVIGGGIVGASCALHLATAGRDVLLVERDAPASKASGRAAGILTTYRAEPFGAAPSRYGRAFFAELATTHDLSDHREPFYRLAHTEEGADRLAAVAAESGLEPERLSPADLRAQYPDLNAETVTAALSFGTGVHLDPHQATVAMLEEAKAAGATVRANESVTGIEAGAESLAVETTADRYPAEAVVIAAGAWSPRVASMVGVELPLRPRTSQIAVLEPAERVDLPILSCPDLGVYARPEGPEGVLVGGGADTLVEDPDVFSTDAREAFLREVADVAGALAPALSDAGLANHWAGRCSLTPEHRPLIGRTDVDGVFVCAGFNGEGLSMSPFAGQLLADLVVGRPPTFDPTGFEPQREADFEMRNAIDW